MHVCRGQLWVVCAVSVCLWASQLNHIYDHASYLSGIRHELSCLSCTSLWFLKKKVLTLPGDFPHCAVRQTDRRHPGGSSSMSGHVLHMGHIVILFGINILYVIESFIDHSRDTWLMLIRQCRTIDTSVSPHASISVSPLIRQCRPMDTSVSPHWYVSVAPFRALGIMISATRLF